MPANSVVDPAFVREVEVLEHVSDYDDDFFEALASVMAHDKGCLRPGRARDFEALRQYLDIVRRRARNGETAAMWRELAQGAAQETDLGNEPFSSSPGLPTDSGPEVDG